MTKTPLPRAQRRAASASQPRTKISHQVKLVCVYNRRLTPEKVAQLFRLARELEGLGL